MAQFWVRLRKVHGSILAKVILKTQGGAPQLKRKLNRNLNKGVAME